ncbi:CYTH-like domain-containing protein [Neocallimastix lanati (nom. inval.)]|jgi:uncharacterized protein YjbK|uniref:CYTH domain-containing protein n=1 Tax=Neocallimastix californiae TaxID=1754190 RepID=A0A1Y2E5P5_9FUNG|nr:CYTH-like domain-containing protein [Neocallimastix sp. JGI-2020a]ORY66888.1 hypothetical protein LY90DRAFT_667821 [Neocallimastix californiae]|eukprot:ORY66888.1 hypothetical protein LY90DRAFT_667821 [Neocallimastix californiae]
METEVKLRISEEAYQKVQEKLIERGFTLKETDNQTNIFLDGQKREMSQKRYVLRFRKIFRKDKYIYFTTLKGNAKLANGISKIEEFEEEIPKDLFEEIVANPSKLPELGLKQNLLTKVLKEHPIESKYEIIGQFTTNRRKFEIEFVENKKWTLELDETEFPFGKAFEIELEVPEDEIKIAKESLEKFMNDSNIPYTYSKNNKFVNLMKGSIDQ